MGSLLVQVAIYGLAAAFAAPIAIVVSALILGKSTRPVIGGWTFVAGAAFLDLVFAIVILAADLFEEGGDAGAIVDVGLGVLFVAMGLLAVFQAESPEKDAARRARAEQIATAKLATLFAAGFFVQVINFDAIAVFGGALKDIGEANITTGQEVIATAVRPRDHAERLLRAGADLHDRPEACDAAARTDDRVDHGQQPEARDRGGARLRRVLPRQGPRRSSLGHMDRR